jgi:O-antigen/teichoic acid export membrane protein
VGQIKKLVGQTAIYGLSSIIGRFLNFLLVPFYTRVFLPDQFGVITELYTYVVFLLIFLTFGMETGYFRFMQNEDDKNKVFPTITLSIFTLVTLFIISVFIFINPISQFLKYEDFQIYIIYIAFIVSLDAFTSIPFAKLRHKNRPVKFAVIKLVNIGTNILSNIIFLVIIPFYAKNYTALYDMFIVDNMVIYVFISNLIASIITIIMLIPEIFEEKLIFDYQLFKRIFLYSFPLLIAGLAGQTNELIDRILLKHFIVVPENVKDANEYVLTQIGIYGANFKLSIIITIFIQAFRYAFEPMFFSKAKSADSKQLYADIMKYFVIFCLIIFLGIMFYIDIIKYFIGDKFHEGLAIVPIAFSIKCVFRYFVQFIFVV